MDQNYQSEPLQIFDSSTNLSRELDPEVASVFLSTDQNYPDDGFEVSLQASFGRERMKLVAGSVTLEVTISFLKAAAVIECENCNLQTTFCAEMDETEAFNFEEVQEIEKGDTFNATAKVNLAGIFSTENKSESSANLESGLAGQWDKTKATKQTRSRSHGPVRRISANRVTFDGYGQALQGRQLSRAKAWRVVPNDLTLPVVVRSQLKVRKDWITFEEPIFLEPQASLAKRLEQKIRGQKKQGEYFMILLEHLAYLSLETDKEAKEASIAAHAIKTAPHSKNMNSVPYFAPAPQIEIPEAPLEQFASSPDGEELETLRAIGVSASTLSKSRSLSLKSPRKSELFLPLVSPIDALEHYVQTVALENEVTTDVWKSEIGNSKTLTVLKRLKLVTVVKNSRHEAGVVRLTDTSVIDPEATFRYAATRTDTIKMARALLLQDSLIAPYDVCQFITLKFGKIYSNDATIDREGRQLLRWARWLDPSLLNPQGSMRERSFLYSARSKEAGRGRAGTDTPENTKLATELYAQGLSSKQVAKEIGVAAETVRRWVRAGKVQRKYTRHKNSPVPTAD